MCSQYFCLRHHFTKLALDSEWPNQITENICEEKMYWCSFYRFVLMCQHACKSSTNFTSNDTSIGLDSIFIQPACSELRHQAGNVLADKVQSVRVLSTQSSARITFQNLQYIRHMEDPQAPSGWTDLIQRMSVQTSHHCTMCSLGSMLSFQPNKLRHILKFVS